MQAPGELQEKTTLVIVKQDLPTLPGKTLPNFSLCCVAAVAPRGISDSGNQGWIMLFVLLAQINAAICKLQSLQFLSLSHHKYNYRKCP